MSGESNVAIAICSAALNLIGADEILSFDDESRESKVCNSIYFDHRDALLQEYRWRFTVRQKQLSLVNQTPLFGFTYVHQLPSDFLALIGTNSSGSHKIFKDKVFSNEENLSIEYQSNVDEVDYPSYFKIALQYKMASILASALLQDTSVERIWEDKYLRQLIRAKSTDSQQNTTGSMPDTNFIFRNVRTL